MRKRALFSIVVLVVVGTPLGAGEARIQGRPTVVNVNCPNNEQGPVNITVNPWLYERNQGQNSEWILNTNRPQTNSIVIEAKGAWPYPVVRHEGNGRATAENMKSDAQGDYEYNITIFCGSDRIVIDPRMRVR